MSRDIVRNLEFGLLVVLAMGGVLAPASFARPLPAR